MKKARYHCLSCNHRWEQDQGGGPVDNHDGPSRGCPDCGHKYLMWENAEEFVR